MRIRTNVGVGVLSAAVVVGGLPFVPVASASAASPVAARGSGVRSIPRRLVPPVPVRSGPGLPQVRTRPVTWPEPAAATVPVTAAGARVGAAPVRVSAPARGRAPERVSVRTLDRAAVAALGGIGVGFTIASATTATATPAAVGSAVTVQVDASGFAGASGGNLAQRLRLLAFPGCALRTPAAARCRVAKKVPATLRNGRLTAQVPVSRAPAAPAGALAAPAAVFVVAAADDGETGTFKASPLASSSRWAVGAGAGGFSWTYPIPAVTPPGGAAPALDLEYSSQMVDGMVASENSQPSWAGLGWDLATPFIERRYTGCSDDGGSGDDLCWAGDVLELSLNGHSSPLVKDQSVSTADVWRLRDDPGWRVERLTGAANGDDNGEYWQVLTPDGTRYTFGKGAQAGTGRATNAAFTVPVYGNGAAEPCHAAPGWCQQAWRWNVDAVVDARGNESSYFYAREGNSYLRGGTTSTPYTRGGQVADIEYGIRAGAEATTAPARLHFSTELRCTGIAGGGATSCPPLTAASSANDYPDVPAEQICTATCTPAQTGPTFFTGKLLSAVTAQRSVGTGANATWSDVDTVAFDYLYPQPTDGSTASLWLSGIRRSGKVGGSQSMPAVTFTGIEKANRVETAAPAMRKLRVAAVTDELGRRVEVTYGTPDPCSNDNIPSPATNTQNCFPAWRGVGNTARFGWWYKYLVTQVKVVDSTGGGPAQVTAYRYGGSPAWHYDDTPATPIGKQSWGDWRGYGRVDVAQLSDPGFRGEAVARTLAVTRTLYFRGMDGDRNPFEPTTGMGSRRFDVTDSTGSTVPDSPWLTGRVREVRHFDLDAAGDPAAEQDGAVMSYAVIRTTPVGANPDDPKHDAHFVVQTRSVNRQTVTADPGGARSTRTSSTDTTYDGYGQPVTSTSTATGSAAAGGGSDVRCTRTRYPRDAATVAASMLGYPYQVRVFAGSCAAPTALVSGVDTYYDGSTVLGGPLSRADATRTVTALAASAPDTVSASTSTAADFDAYGRLVSATDGNGRVTRTAFTPATGLATSRSVTDALGRVTTSTLEPGRGTTTAVQDANAQTTTLAYDPLGRLTTVRLPGQAAPAAAGYTFDYALDPARQAPPRTTTRTLQSGSTYITSTQFADSLGRARQTQTVSPASSAGTPRTIVSDTRYDDRGLVAARTLPVVTAGTAGAGLVAVGPAAAVETRYRYDATGREVGQDHVAAGVTKWTTTTAYFGDHTRTTPPAGGVVSAAWTDLRGRVIRTDEGTGAALVSTLRRFDDADRVVRSTDPAGHFSTTTYDLVGRRIAGHDPDAGDSSATYDGAGNQLSATDGLGVKVSTDYDALDRPVTRWQGSSGTGTRLNTWTYDSTAISNGLGRPAAQTTIDAGLTYTQAVTGYDARGQVSGKSWTFPAGLGGSLIPQKFSTAYTYDDAGHQTSIRYPDRVVGLDPEKVTTDYDPLGNPNTLTGTTTPLIGPAGTVPYVSATGYAADGKLLSRAYANPLYPITRRYGYEADTQRLGQISTAFGDPLQPGTSTKQDDTYRWDPAGNLTSVVDNAPQLPLIGTPTATCYDYDALDRLRHAWTSAQTGCTDGSSTTVHDGPSGFNQSWTYSPDGNITSARSLLVSRDFAYDDANHPHAVTRAGLDVFGYDAAGQQNTRIKSLVPGVLTYTPQHLLSTVTSGVATTKIVYTGDGTRLARLNPNLTATLYIDGQEISIVAGIAKGTRYYRLASTLVGQRLITGLLTWQLNDHQGSAQISVLAGTGVPIRTYYDPYGKVRDLSAAPTTDHGFLGRIADPTTGVDALDQRSYDPDLGRFLSTDPLDVQASAQTANPYSYSANNPARFSDPTGLCPVDVCGVGTPIGDGRIATTGPVDPGNPAAGSYRDGVFVPPATRKYEPVDSDSDFADEEKVEGPSTLDNIWEFGKASLANGSDLAIDAGLIIGGALLTEAGAAGDIGFGACVATGVGAVPCAAPLAGSVALTAAGVGVVAGGALKLNQDLNTVQSQASDNAARGARVPPPKDLKAFPNAARARPKTPVKGGGGLRKRWVDSKNGEIYEWDSQHGTVEKYTKNGKHLGEYDPVTGEQTKGPDPTRTVEN